MNNQVPPEARIDDDRALLVLLEVSRHDIVFYQGLFESYEGVGTVRTMDPEKPIIAILTTPDMLDTVLALLESDVPPWRYATDITAEQRERFQDFL